MKKLISIFISIFIIIVNNNTYAIKDTTEKLTPYQSIVNNELDGKNSLFLPKRC